MVKAVINGLPVEVDNGTTILDAARRVHVDIPVLCKHPDLEATAACGICIVRIKGSPKMLRSCCTPLEEGMDIVTHDPEIIDVRRSVIELIMSKHPNECLTCGRNQNCELQKLAADFGIRNESFPDLTPDLPLDDSNGTITLDPRKCISCGRCVLVCQEVQNVWALCFNHRGFDTVVSAAGVNMAESPCVSCGQCSAHCPTGAIVEHDATKQVWDMIQDPELHVVVQIAPAVRVAIGEAFGYPNGSNLTEKLYAALRRMGFDKAFDTNWSADLTIMEEGSEFIERFVKGNGALPLITSCCPAWVDFMEKYANDLCDNFSSAKSPQQMLGAVAKTYYAEKAGIDASKMRVVSIMPCTAKKMETARDDSMNASGQKDVDVALTTRELSRMIKQAGIDFVNLPGENADSILGQYTGAGTIFGVTGGVMEAALRTAVEKITGEALPKVEFEQTRGLQGIKEAALNVAGHEVRIAVAHGLKNVEDVLDRVRAARDAGEEPPYHFIEVMACPGGCIGGGGQPYGVTDELRIARTKGIYADDERCALRKSHENPEVLAIYEEYLDAPLSEKAHKLLHTHYVPRLSYKR
ncbi:MAG: NADH-dependent [FeFe] hydrogenase, group A6 [Planctomycetota bacterium]